MPTVQTKLDLPARKPRKTRVSSEKEIELKTTRLRRTKNKQNENESPVPSSPQKRSAMDQQSDALSSPTKQSKTPAKAIGSRNENIGNYTPSGDMAKLGLKSPRHPLEEKRGQAVSFPLKKGPLFSPQKTTSESITDLLDNPTKLLTPTKRNLLSSAENFPVRSSPLKSTRTPAKSPFKSNVASPKRMTVGELEDLLCSPAKTIVKKVDLQRSPRKPLTPTKISSSPMKRSLFSPSKPAVNTPILYQADVSQFEATRAALHTGTPTTLLCRDTQVTAMSTWLDNHLVAGQPGSIYVSGAPGTGKTATLVNLLNSKVAKFKSIFINCMVLKSAIAIYRELAKQLKPKSNPKTEKAAIKIIEEVITNSPEMILLVLDEVDQLESKDQSVLYTVFEWPALPSSKLALVGIANSLDLTDRVLPRLHVNDAYRPTLLHYPPYTKQQLIEILTSRIKEGMQEGGSTTPVITPRAIAFLASKISSLSGDLRKALDVCRRALELAEGLVRKQTLLKPMTPKGLANPLTSPRKGYKNPKVLPQVGQVDLPQIMKVINQVYGSQVTASLGTKGEGLPVQQKILIASLLLMVKKGRTKEVTLGKLIGTYSNVLKKRNMKPELESSCVGMVEMLESRGMVTYICKGAPRMAKVSLRMDEEEVGIAFGDKAMLGAIIDDITCIAK